MSEPVGVSGNQLRAIIERIEHVEEEIKALAEAKKEIYQEAKGNGFDAKIADEKLMSPRCRTSPGLLCRCP